MLVNYIILIFCIVYIDSANILCYFATPSISHQNVFQPIWTELAKRGHQVTVITPNPLNNASLKNLREIDINFVYNIMSNFTPARFSHDSPILDRLNFFNDFTQAIGLPLSTEETQKLIRSEENFDIIILTPYSNLAFGFPAKFRKPTIAISSMGVLPQTHDSIGNPTHPLLFKDIFFNYQGQPTLYDKVSSVLYNIWYRALYYWYFLPQADKLAREYFGDDIPYLGDVEKNVSLVLVNENCLMNTVRPNVPNMVQIGQVHIREKRPLPEDLQDYLDKSTKGVVYLSLGSNVKSANLSENVRNTIIGALTELPYNVLWKWETDSLPGQPKNVITRKWLPQQDVLGHPNVKAFITQGGFQSIEEAIHNEVPMIGMPFMSDQPENVRRLVELGMAKMVDYKTMTKDELKNSIREVAQNKKYKEQVQKSKAILEDQPIKGLEKAIWWIEYVIRHKGAPHLRSPAADMSLFEYFMVDAIAVILVAALTVIALTYYILRILLWLIGCRRNVKKIKTN